MTTATFEAPQVHQHTPQPASHINISFREDGFGSTTYGSLGYRKLEPAQASEPATLNTILEARLSILCDKLRAKY